MQVILLVILAIYLICIYTLGARVIHKWLPGFPALLSGVGAFLVGTGVGVPVTYLFSCVFSTTNDPILWGTAVSIVFFAPLLFSWKKKIPNVDKQRLFFSDIAVAALSLVFSSWMMLKTFHGDASGQLFVGSNNVFDFGHALGIIRSFSWGSNIPISSPFESGSPFFYHFFFYFFVAIWEYLGVPIVWAVNVPSVLSFTALLIVIYYLPQIVSKQKPFVGWITVALTVMNSSLTFLYMKNLSGLWRLPTYPFAGPFDGSTISLFVTLNNYINQRHLAFSAALGLLLYLFVVRALETKKMSEPRVIILGVITGILLFWNMAICALVGTVVLLTLLLHKTYKAAGWYMSASIFTGIICILPVVPYLAGAVGLIQQNVVLTSAAGQQADWNIITYLWQNLGILPLIAATGYILLSKKTKRFLLPFSTLFVMECLFAAAGHKGFDQKFLSFLIIPVNMLAAVGLWWFWKRKRLAWKVISVLIFCVLTVSGIVDLMPIKNEFAFPIVGKQILPVISWIHINTPKAAVFVSYADIIDPVVLAGRKNYFGFFGNIGWQDRSAAVREIYGGDITVADKESINYILIPKTLKSDFPYSIQMQPLKTAFSTVYKDEEFLVLKVH